MILVPSVNCSTPLKVICNDSDRFEMSMLHKFFINSEMFKSQKINSLLMVCPTWSSREYRYATLQPLCYIFSGIFFLFQTLMYYSLYTVHWDTPLGHVAACCLAMHCFLPSFQFPQFSLLCSNGVQFVPACGALKKYFMIHLHKCIYLNDLTTHLSQKLECKVFSKLNMPQKKSSLFKVFRYDNNLSFQ